MTPENSLQLPTPITQEFPFLRIRGSPISDESRHKPMFFRWKIFPNC